MAAPDDPPGAAPDAAGTERRRYFRIEEHVILLFREVADGELPDGVEPPSAPFTLAAQLELLSRESRALMRRVERESPAIAEYLKLLDRKLELIGRSLVATGPELADCDPRAVNLSASGIAFGAERPYAPGQMLEIKLALLPNLAGMVAYGRVVYCQDHPDPEGPPYRVGVDFVGLNERDRELLVRHITQRQSRRLRDNK